MEGFRENGVDFIRFLFRRITLAKCSGQNASVCEALALPGYKDVHPPSIQHIIKGQAERGQAEQPLSPQGQAVNIKCISLLSCSNPELKLSH